jgi:glycosyltransferase involved in cell wall biosynthesis
MMDKMDNKKVSVIIPACNEEGFIKNTVDKYRSQDYPVEIIIVVNNSQDKTYDLIKTRADKVLNISEKIGVSAARNKGAEIASGDIFIFSDADSFLENGAIRKIADSLDENTIGSPLGRQDAKSLRGQLFFLFKNWTRRLGLHNGVIDGILFCYRNVFFDVNGFDDNKIIAEFDDFISRAKIIGVKYKLFTNIHAITSLRRYIKNGYLNSLLFWIIWKTLAILKKDEIFREKYFK